MIQKLRKKFIIINMVLVNIVLLAAMGIYCYSSYRKGVNDSMMTMHMLLDSKHEQTKPKLEIGEKRKSPEFTRAVGFRVVLNDDGTILEINADNAEVSDEFVNQAVECVENTEQSSGIIRSLGLRYLKAETPIRNMIAFVDMQNERETMKRNLVVTLLIILGASVAFFIISFYLSKWILRPVQKAWEQQRQFVADASHELKTPLTVILANTSILLAHRKETIESQLKWVAHTEEEAKRMKTLVEDMLYLAKSDTAKVDMLMSNINLSQMVWESSLHFESIAFEQGVKLESEIEEEVMIQGNEGQLKQLIAILLDNACKYAGCQGKVKIILEKNYDKIQLSIHNTGSEIPKEQMEHIFERFYRVDESRSQNVTGYGLGLAIAQTIACNHKGKISVQSSAEEGTTFKVTLPKSMTNDWRKNSNDSVLL